MSRMKDLVSIAVLGCTFLLPGIVHGAEVKPVQTKAVQVGTKEEIATSTSSAITFEKDEYVRIAQSLTGKEEIQTFDSQINIMGEARTGTAIEIIVYTGEKVDNPKATATNHYKTYTLKEVGATKLFSQLIDLQEDQNNVIISYSYPADKKSGKIYLTIRRKTEKEKEQIKSFIVDDATLLKSKR